MVRTRVWVGWLCLSAFFTVGVGGCDKLGLGEDKKSSSKKSDKDDDDDDDKKKKKKKSKDDDDDKAAAPMPVPNIAGFVVPAGGKHNHVDETFGSSRLVFESMDYPLKEFPRDKLRADFLAGAKGAGWACNPKGATDYDCSKDGAVVGVLFGEAGAEQTKINVFPPKGGAGGSAGGTVFAGTYSSAWGSVIFTQKASDPGRVTGRYPKGSILCAPQDQKLDCTWAESGAAGRAVFTKTADGGMLGTWGSGGSASSGGAWNLRLVTPGTIE